MSGDVDRVRDEIAVLVASLDDARAEHASGDLDDASLDAIVTRDEARMADANARLVALDRAPRAAPPIGERHGHRRRGRLLVAGVCLALAVGAAVVAASDPFAAAPRPPRITTHLKVKGLLFVAELAVEKGEQLRALTAYEAVLALAPNNVEAIIETGWLRYEQGLVLRRPRWERAGAATLRHAVRIAPHDASAHLYDGIVLYQFERDRRAALEQIERAGELPETTAEQDYTAEFLAVLEPKR